MKRIVLILLFLLFTAACSGEGGEKIDGKQPQDVAIEWITAHAQADFKKKYELIQPKVREQFKKTLLEDMPKSFPKEEVPLKPNYTLTEYQVDDETFYYDANYENSKGNSAGDTFKIIKTEEGWKVSGLRLHGNDFEKGTKDAQDVRVIKGASKQ